LTPADADAIVATAMRALASLIQCPCPVSSPYGPLIGQDSHIGPDAMALAAPPLLPMRRPRWRGISAEFCRSISFAVSSVPAQVRDGWSVKDIGTHTVPPPGAFTLLGHSAYRALVRDYLDW